MDELDQALLAVKLALTGMSASELPSVLAQRADFNELLGMIRSMQEFILALGNGDLSKTLAFKGPCAGSMKALQASLRHLTWQAQMIAGGDFSQRVDFLGDFSSAFNTMVINLEQAKRQNEESSQRLSSLNCTLQQEVEERKRLETEERAGRQRAERLRLAGEELNKSLDMDEILNVDPDPGRYDRAE